MKKRLIFVFITVLTLLIMIGTSSLAAWWGTPGYEWALARGLTSMKTQSQLTKTVTISDYYEIILKYLNLKGVATKNEIVQNTQVGSFYNGALTGMMNQAASYIDSSVKSVSPQQYKILNEYIENAKRLMVEYSNDLSRDNLKDLNLFLDLVKYRGAMLLSEETKAEEDYKRNILYGLRNTKYAASLSYGIMPICGKITRGDFLVLMHNLLSSRELTRDDIIKSFNESGVLLGYYNNLWLDEEIRYSEILTFLYRFESYDFNATENVTEMVDAKEQAE